MRLAKDHKVFLKRTISMLAPNADVFLIGSRVNDRMKGGDIDILVIGKEKLSFQQIRSIKIAFYRKYGEQKIDIVSFEKDETSTFKDLVLIDGIRL